jgi:predicted anti-sigma-YlaC factor YlaD
MTSSSDVRPFACGLLLLVLSLSLPGCAVKKMAINMVGNSLAESGTTFSGDDDPELVKAAVPFGLKLMESLLAQSPRHRGLLTAACSNFTQFSYAFVQLEADYVEAQDLQKATEMRERAKKLYLRARDYGFRGLELDIPGFRDRVRKDPDATLAKTGRKHVPLLYYTAASWAAAFAVDITDSRLSADQPVIEKMMRRALALDETWGQGSIHDFFISWEAGHAAAGGSLAKAREHYKRARELGAGQRISPQVSLAESLAGSEKNQQYKQEFVALLDEAVLFDVEKSTPEQKLANVIAQRRAKWLLSRVDELF